VTSFRVLRILALEKAGPLGGSVYAPSTDGAWRHVRAVPCTAGSAVIFSHRTIHWGSQGRPGSSHGPRVSISFAGSDHSYAVASDVVLIVASIRPQVYLLASGAFAGLDRCIPFGGGVRHGFGSRCNHT
jgi:hypothetical protein